MKDGLKSTKAAYLPALIILFTVSLVSALSITSPQTLEPGEVLQGSNLFLNASLTAASPSDNFTLNFTDQVKLQSEAELSGNADVFADSINGVSNVSLTAGNPGNFFLCERAGNVRCNSVSEEGVELEAVYERKQNRALLRTLESGWTQGFAGWKDDLSPTEKIDSTFSGTQANYTVTGLKENTEFKILKDGEVQKTQTSFLNPEKVSEKQFSGSKTNVSGTGSIELNLTAVQGSTAGDTYNNNDGGSIDGTLPTLFVPQQDLVIEGILGYSRSPADLSFEIRKGGVDGEILYSASGLSHDGSDFNLFKVDELVTLSKGSTYALRAGSTGKVYFEDPRLFDNDPPINWSSAPNRDVLYASGLSVNRGFKSTGTYFSNPVDAGREIDWTGIEINGSIPQNTSVEVSFTENSSGSFGEKYYSSIDQVPDSRYIKYNLTLSTQDSFKSPEINSVNILYNPLGPDGAVNLSTSVSGPTDFQVREDSPPEASSVRQSNDSLGYKQENNLSAILSDPVSGLKEARLATNQSGQLENRSEYVEKLGFESERLVDFLWQEDSFRDRTDTIRWQIWFKDASDNWAATQIKTFQVDGNGPVFESIGVDSFVDVDSGTSEVSAQLSDSFAQVSNLKLSENSTGTFENRSLSDSTSQGDPFVTSTVVQRETPGPVSLRFFGRDTLDNFQVRTREVKFQNLTVDSSLGSDRANSSETVEVSGTVLRQPNSVPIEVPVEIWEKSGDWRKITPVGLSKDPDGSFSSQISLQESGRHRIRVNASDSNAISGRDDEFLTVLLNVSNPESLFSDGSRVADVDSESRNITLSARVAEVYDDSVESVNAEIDVPGSTTRTFELSRKSETRIWNTDVNTSREFGDSTGRFNVSFTAVSASGISSNVAETSFSVRNVSLEASFSRSNLTLDDNSTLSGQVLGQPSGKPLTGTLTLDRPGGTQEIGVNEGSFSKQISPEAPGIRGFDLSFTTENGTKGVSSLDLNAFNLTADIGGVQVDGQRSFDVFRDRDTDADLSFQDTVSTSGDNPFSVFQAELGYEVPEGFISRSPEGGTKTFPEIVPGASKSFGPPYDLSPSTDLGPKTVNASVNTREGLRDNDSVRIDVFSKSKSGFLGKFETGVPELDRSKTIFNLSMNVTDVATGETLEGINVSASVNGGDLTSSGVSNGSGIAEVPINLKKLGTGEGFQLTAVTRDNVSKYINSSESVGELENIRSFDIKGKMQKGSQDSLNPVFRKDSFEDSSETVSGKILDSAGDNLNDVTVEASVRDRSIGTDTTGDDGLYAFNYNPERSVRPGPVNVTLTAQKGNFSDFVFNRTVEVRGSLGVENFFERKVIQRGTSVRVSSEVRNEFGETVEGNVSWSLNSTSLGDGENATFDVPVIERGIYNLTPSTDRSFYDDSSDPRQVEVYGLADLDLTPEDFTIRPGNEVEFVAEVTDSNTSEPVEDYPVKFEVDGTSETVSTNSSGEALFRFTPGPGSYDLKASIQDNASLRYNASVDTAETSIEAKDKLYLDRFTFTEKDIFRYTKTPYRTVFDINLTRNSDTIDRVPVENREVKFTVNGSETVSCTTDATGACSQPLIYNPSGAVKPGNLTVEASTDVPDRIDVDRENSLVVRGLLLTSIQQPQDQIDVARTDSVPLSASTDTLSGGEIRRDMTWKVDGETVATGYDAEWNVPEDIETGPKKIEALGNGEFVSRSVKSRDVFVLGKASVNLQNPLPDRKGYRSPEEIACSVTSGASRIGQYPVEFLDNRSGELEPFASEKTSGDERLATTSWQPPQLREDIRVACRIEKNRTLGFVAEQPLDSKTVEVFDNVKPEITNLDIEERISPGDVLETRFNASDESGIRNLNATVINPFLTEVNAEQSRTRGTGFRSTFGTEGRARGTYKLKLNATDTSGNSRLVKKPFNVQPGGLIDVDPKTQTASQITQTVGKSFNVDVSLLIDNGGDAVNITVDTESEGLAFNTSKYECGDIEAGNRCNRSFKVQVQPGTPPTEGVPLFASFRGNWEKSADSEASLGDFVEVSVEANPVLEEKTSDITGDSKITVPHGTSLTLEDRDLRFNVSSSGNTPVNDLETEFISGTLEPQLVEIIDGQKQSLTDGSSLRTDVGFDIPLGTPPSPQGNPYNGTVKFRSDNTDPVERQIELKVRQDSRFESTDRIESSAVRGSSGKLGEIRLESLGNVPLELGISTKTPGSPEDGPCARQIELAEGSEIKLEPQETRNVSVLYDFSPDLSDETCKPQIVFNSPLGDNEASNVSIDIRSFTVDALAEKTSAVPGENLSFAFRPLLAGEQQDSQQIEFSTSINGSRIDRRSVDRNASGWFRTRYTLPEVEDAATHDIELTIRQKEFDVSRAVSLNERVQVPDLTPPRFGEFDVVGTEPNSTQVIDVPVTDNSGSLSSVNLSIQTPSGEILNRTLSRRNGAFETEIEEADSGLYTVEATVEDDAGLNSTAVDRFRISGQVTFQDDFSTSDGAPNQDSKVSFVDFSTGLSRNVSVPKDGTIQASLKNGRYNVTARFDGQVAKTVDTPIDENTSTLRAQRISADESSGLTPPDSTGTRIGGIAVKTDLQPERAVVTFNYSGFDIPDDTTFDELQVARCKDLDYGSLRCGSGSFDILEIDPLDVNKARKTITVSAPGFSSYTIFDPAGNQQDQQDEQSQQDDDGGGGGGGGGLTEDDLESVNETVSETRETVENISSALNDSGNEQVELGSSSINAELSPGESKRVSVSISNNANDTQTFVFSSGEVVERFVNEPDSVDIGPGGSRDVVINLSAPAGERPGTYSGSLSIESDEINTDLPVNVQVLPPNERLLDMSVDPVFSVVEPGAPLRVETTFSNQGYARDVDISADLKIIDPEDNSTVARLERTLAVGTTLTKVFDIPVPDDAELKRYTVRGSARYTNLDVSRVATAASSVQVNLPFWSRTFLGFTYSSIGLGFVLVLLVSAGAFSIYHWKKQKELKKKRYMENIDLDTIPTGGDDQAYLGDLAEVGTRTFLRLDDLTTHALIAGATGSGKTVTGQVMVEEALSNGANVIVLDPTAQWTGYLRENGDPSMEELYDEFGLSSSDARGYDGNIRAVEPGDEIDITPYLEQDEDGQIIVFSLHKLDSKNIDEFANKTIQQIFDANLPERNHLETVIVYDEVHRLLEKFGGSGKGLKQLERGAREFRKWGVGMVLLSQVISDFSGEIRANIGTTVQMRTQYDDDLDRIREKFGIDTVKSIAKAEVGSGMLQNSDYNHGRPYFINFRPLLHSPHRLSDDQLDKYEKYNKRIDAIEEEIRTLEEEGEDVYEYNSELKLTKRNLKKGSFSLVDTYIEELEEKLDI